MRTTNGWHSHNVRNGRKTVLYGEGQERSQVCVYREGSQTEITVVNRDGQATVIRLNSELGFIAQGFGDNATLAYENLVAEHGV